MKLRPSKLTWKKQILSKKGLIQLVSEILGGPGSSW